MSGDNDEYLGGKSKRPRSLKLKKPMKKPTKKALLRKNIMKLKYFGGFFSEDAPTMPPMPPMPPMPAMPSGETIGGYRSKKVHRPKVPKVAGPRPRIPRMSRPMRRQGGEGESGSYLDGPMNIASKYIFDPTMGSITKGAEQTYQALENLKINGGIMRLPKRRPASPKRRPASPKRRAASPKPKRRAALPKRRPIMVNRM
jgi:hypothetical protein